MEALNRLRGRRNFWKKKSTFCNRGPNNIAKHARPQLIIEGGPRLIFGFDLPSMLQPFGNSGSWQAVRSLKSEILYRHRICLFLKYSCRSISPKEDENFVFGTMSWLSIFRGKCDSKISSIDITFQAVNNSC